MARANKTIILAPIISLVIFIMLFKGVNAVGPDLAVTKPVYKKQALPRLRGVQVSPDVTGDDLNELGLKWNANVIRWQLIWTGRSVKKTDLQAYDKWLERSLTSLDSLLPACKKAGLMVVIALHTAPGDRNQEKENLIFKEKIYQQKLVEVWERIAERYKDSEIVWGYDIVNEPVVKRLTKDLYEWQELAELTATKIREKDKIHVIIVEPTQWGNPDGLNYFKPLNTPGVVYSVHMYAPHKFTHQGVKEERVVGLKYPGVIDGKLWDKKQLLQVLEPVAKFQKKYEAHIYVGEFSVIRWAPGDSGYNYLKDVIDIFEANGWDWSYHAFREWNGWSVEHNQNPNDNEKSGSYTNRQVLLTSYLQNNNK